MQVQNGIGISNAIVAKEFRAILGEKLRRDGNDLPDDATLEELGFDSLALSDLAEAVQGRLDVEIPNRTFPASFTVREVIDFLVAEMAGAQVSEQPVAGEAAD